MTKTFSVIVQRTAYVEVELDDLKPGMTRDEILELILDKAYEEELYSLDSESSARLYDENELPMNLDDNWFTEDEEEDFDDE